jgi:dTDP-glucose 4,6-dehydratase
VNPIGPRGVYDEAKRFAEAMTMAYHRYHGVATRIVRIFNTYGPRMRPKDGRVVPAFISRGPQGRAHHGVRRRQADPQLLLRVGPDRGHHTFDDERLSRAGEHRQSARDDGAGFRPRDPRLCGSTAPIVHKPLPVDDPKVRQPNITRAREILKWEPRMDLEAGLQKTIDYFKQLIAQGKL